MWNVKKIEVRPGHRLWVEFADGLSGELDLSADLFGPLGQPLMDDKNFAEAFIDEFGAVAWPNGFDLGPDWLHAILSERPYDGEPKSQTLAAHERPTGDE